MTTRSPLVHRLHALADVGRPAILEDLGATSHRELVAMAAAAAARASDGAASLEGRRIAVLEEPGARFVAALWGVMLAGGVAVPVSPMHPEGEIRYVAADAGIDAVFLGQAFADRAGWFGAARVLSTHELSPSRLPAVLPAAADVALMLYTSGTTGRPKGACITHDNVATQAELLGEAWRWTEHDRLLHALPLHHLHGLGIGLMSALFAGASARMLPRFEPRRFWDEMAGATVSMAVPTMYHRLFEAFDAETHARRDDWSARASGLRLATSGSAALPVSLAERWRAITGVIPVERFGMTEIGVGMSNPLDGPRKPGSVGLPLRTVEMRIVGEDGADVANGEAGEIHIRGPSVFPAYFGRPDATNAAFRDGWFLTGDTASQDPHGYVRILGRTSVDILKSGGYKLSALEIEEALRLCPDVLEVAVVGVPDERWGDRVVAVIVPRPGSGERLSTDAVRGFCKEHLAPYKIPREVVLRAELPRNQLGKVMKPELLRSLVTR